MKVKLFFFLGLFIFNLSLVAEHVPKTNKNFNEYSFEGKLFLKSNNFKPLKAIVHYRMGVERQTRTDNVDQLRVGLLYRPSLSKGLSGLKFLANYQANWGLRHNEDWVKPNAIWQWQDTASRYEAEFSGGFQYRLFLGLDNLIGELRVLFANNTFNSNNNLVIRPGLRYFLLDKGDVYASMFLRYEGWLALNFANNEVWENWAYAGFLYHFSQKFQVGFTLAYKTQNWVNTIAFEQKLAATYSVTDSSIIWGLQVIYRLSI